MRSGWNWDDVGGVGVGKGGMGVMWVVLGLGVKGEG